MKFLFLFLFVYLFNSNLLAEQNNNKCKFFYYKGIDNIKYQCLVEKTTKGFFFDDIEKHIISGKILNLNRTTYVTDGDCSKIKFEVKNSYLDFNIKKCNLLISDKEIPIEVKNNNISLSDIISSSEKENISKKELYQKEYKELNLLLHFNKKIGTFNILVDKDYETFISKIYQRRLDKLPEWKKVLVFYNRRFDFLNIKSKYLDIENIDGKIEDMKVIGLIENTSEKELILFYIKSKDNLKINFEFNNFLTLTKLYKAIDYQQIEFDYQLEKMKLNKLKNYYKNVKRVTFRKMNLIKENKDEYNEHNNQELLQWVLRLIPESLNEFNYSLKPTEQIVLKIYKMD